MEKSKALIEKHEFIKKYNKDNIDIDKDNNSDKEHKVILKQLIIII